MTHGEEFLADADVGPLGAEDPRARDQACVDRMRMSPFAFFRFVASTRKPYRDNLGLLSSHAISIGVGEQNLSAADRFGGLDGADEHDTTHWYQGSLHDEQR